MDRLLGSWPMLVSAGLPVESSHSGYLWCGSRHALRWLRRATGGTRRETGLQVSAAAHRSPACRLGAMRGVPSRAVQRRAAGTTGRLAAEGNRCVLRGPVGAAQTDPAGPAGCGGVVLLVPTGDAAPAEPGVRRVLPAGQGRRDTRLPAVQASAPVRQRGMAPRTVTAAAGSLIRAGCTCKGSDR